MSTAQNSKEGESPPCTNCDDRKCMACVMREVHDACEDDCPFCCEPPKVPYAVEAWRCPECGHWAGSSYLRAPESNPAWRPRCKMKAPVECSRPLMEPMILMEVSPRR